MSVQIPSDFQSFVRRLIESRRFLSEEDVVAEGLRMLQARETLKQEVELGFSELDQGKGMSAEDVFQRLKSQIADQ